MQKFMKILLKLDEAVARRGGLRPRGLHGPGRGVEPPRGRRGREAQHALPRPRRGPIFKGSTPPLFPGLVLGWINADFRVQIRILQHFSRSSRISSSRKQICRKKGANFRRILQKIITFWKISENLQSLQIFTKFLQNLLQNFVKSCRF